MLTRQQANVWKLAAILAAGAALRLYHLNHQSLWHDEAISVIVGRAPLDQTLNYFRAQPGRLPFEYNPPLYAYLLHVWFAIFGVSDFAARLLSAAAGILCLPVIYVLAADLFGRPAGRNAALLLAVSQLGVMFSQEARQLRSLSPAHAGHVDALLALAVEEEPSRLVRLHGVSHLDGADQLLRRLRDPGPCAVHAALLAERPFGLGGRCGAGRSDCAGSLDLDGAPGAGDGSLRSSTAGGTLPSA